MRSKEQREGKSDLAKGTKFIAFLPGKRVTFKVIEEVLNFIEANTDNS